MWSGSFTRVQLWDAQTGQPRSPVLWPETAWCYTFFTPDSARLYVLNSRKVVHLWDLVTGKALVPPVVNLKDQNLHWSSSDGQLPISIRADAVRLWDAVTGEPATPVLVDWCGRRAAVEAAQFVAGTRTLLVRGEDWVEYWPLPSEDQPLESLLTRIQLLAA